MPFNIEYIPDQELCELKKCPYCDSQQYDWVIHNGTEVIGCSDCLQRIDSDDDYCWQKDGEESYDD